MNRQWLGTAFFFALLLLILYFAFLILTPFLKAIAWAVILAILVYPVYAWLLKLLRWQATPAALIVIVAITLLVIIPGIELGWFLTDEAITLVQTVRSLMTDDGLSRWAETPWVQSIVIWWDVISFRLIDFKINWKEILAQGAQVSSGFIVSQVKGVAQNILLVIVNFIIALFTLFFLLRDGKDFFRRIQRLLPMDSEHQERLFKNIVDAVLAVVHGSFVVAVIQGLLAGLAYWAAGVPFAALWGVVTAFFALLPVGGSTLVSIPVCLYLFFSRRNAAGLFTLRLVSGGCWNRGQCLKAAANRQSPGSSSFASFLRHIGRHCAVRRAGNCFRPGHLCSATSFAGSLLRRICRRGETAVELPCVFG